MNKPLLLLALLIIVAGCSKDIDLIEQSEPGTRAGVNDANPVVLTRSLEGAVYNEVTGSWMIPQNDPYTLENFQKAFNNLATKKSAQILSKAMMGEFAVAKKLSPTHYALKIYPRTEEEQMRVETMDDVQFSYIPFNYAQLTQEEVDVLLQTRTESAANTFSEKSPYTVTYEGTMSDGQPDEPKTFQLPILYAVWPVEKPLPNDMDYAIDYEVFLPHAATETESVEALTVLQNEAQISALGSIVPTPVAATSKLATRATKGYYNARGRLGFVDTGIFSFSTGSFLVVPMGGLEVQYQVGSNIITTVTDSDGRFSCQIDLPGTPTDNVAYSMYIYTNYKNSKWRITNSTLGTGHLTQTVMAKVAVSQTYYPLTELPLSNSNRMMYNAHRAANYFFNVQTDFPKNAPSGGIPIIVYDHSHSKYQGLFHCTPDRTNCYIELWNNSITTSNSLVLGTVLHELGHLAHYMAIDPYDFNYTEKLLQESFASYAAWHLGETHLKSIGWSKPSGYSDITGNARQDWRCDLGYLVITPNADELKYYSPLFIDLADDYDQSVNKNPSVVNPGQPMPFPADSYSGATPSEIWNMTITSRTYQQCRPKLINWAQTHCTADYLMLFNEFYLNRTYDYFDLHKND